MKRSPMPPRKEYMSAELAAGRELDALVAELVMGYQRRPAYATGGVEVDVWESTDYRWPDGVYDERELRCRAGPPPYSTDIGAAWRIVQVYETRGMWVDVYNLFTQGASFWMCHIDNGSHMPVARGETAPLAICRAALHVAELKI